MSGCLFELQPPFQHTLYTRQLPTNWGKYEYWPFNIAYCLLHCFNVTTVCISIHNYSRCYFIYTIPWSNICREHPLQIRKLCNKCADWAEVIHLFKLRRIAYSLFFLQYMFIKFTVWGICHNRDIASTISTSYHGSVNKCQTICLPEDSHSKWGCCLRNCRVDLALPGKLCDFPKWKWRFALHAQSPLLLLARLQN